MQAPPLAMSLAQSASASSRLAAPILAEYCTLVPMMQVALLDEDRVVAAENVGVVLLHVAEFLERPFLGESRRNLDSPRLRLRGRAAAWRLHARGKRPFLLNGRTAEGRSGGEYQA